MIRQIAGILGTILLLAGCSFDVSPPYQPPELTYAHLGMIDLDVSGIEVVDVYESPYKWPNVEHTWPIAPASAVHHWANDRLRAAGADRFLRFEILDASVIEEKLPYHEGLTGLFYTEPSEKYTTRLQVVMKVYGSGQALPESSVTIEAERSQTVMENASLEERERLFVQMVEALMQDFNTAAERNISQYLGAYTLPGDAARTYQE